MKKLILSVMAIGMLVITSCSSEKCSDEKSECCGTDSTKTVENDSLNLENDSLE